MATRLPLSFDGPLVLVGGGRVETADIARLGAGVAGLVGADRGADAIVTAGLVPDAVIGDMDSVSDRHGFPQATRIVVLPEQDTTDFEKCLYATRAPLTLALGMTGGRLDHTLAAFHAMARHCASRRIVLIDEHDLALGVSGSIMVRVGQGARVSIYPLGRTGFARSAGLLYPLDGLTLAQGRAIGTSNTATEDMVIVETAPGAQDPWLLIVERSLFDQVIAATPPPE